MDFDLNDELEEQPRVEKWDPPPHQREWYSNKRTGDRGWKVIRDFQDCMKYDQPNWDRFVPYHESEWTKQEQSGLLLPSELAQVCHAADKVMCHVAKLYAVPRKEW